jgi:integrase
METERKRRRLPPGMRPRGKRGIYVTDLRQYATVLHLVEETKHHKTGDKFSLNTADREEAIDAHDELVEKLNAARRSGQGKQKPRNATISSFLPEFMKRWTNEGGRDGRPRSEREIAELQNVKLYRAEQFFEDTALAKITRALVIDWSHRLLSDPGLTRRAVEAGETERPSGLSKRSVKHHVAALHNLFEHAIEAGLLPEGHNPCHKITKRLRVEKQKPKWLSPAEAVKFLKAAKAEGDDFRALVMTLFFTGARLGEVLGLRVEDVRLDDNEVHIYANEHRRVKNASSDRTMSLWPRLRPVLMEWIGERTDGLVFPDDAGGKRKYIHRQAWARVCEATGLRLNPHGARHTYISQRRQCLDGGKPVSDSTVAEEVGHTTTDQIEKTYGHVAKVRVRVEGFDYAPPADTKSEAAD